MKPSSICFCDALLLVAGFLVAFECRFSLATNADDAELSQEAATAAQRRPLVDKFCFRACLAPHAKLNMRQLFCNMVYLKPYHACSHRCFFDAAVEQESLQQVQGMVCGETTEENIAFQSKSIQEMLDEIDAHGSPATEEELELKDDERFMENEAKISNVKDPEKPAAVKSNKPGL